METNLSIMGSRRVVESEMEKEIKVRMVTWEKDQNPKPYVYVGKSVGFVAVELQVSDLRS